ncbi:UPF0613 protein PB24D3.06c 1 [Cladorrhinum sp. PSN259]|nr:UPF0613 protein PB24D3.06c 1 [Cladorrhinum sp. PSN259]
MAPYTVKVHPLSSPTNFSLTAYERIISLNGGGGSSGGTSSSSSPASQDTCKNALIYIGGLTTGPHTGGDSDDKRLGSSSSSCCWTLFELRMRSSYSGWGYSSLKNDVEDLGVLVKYLREELGKERVVMIGASTGCQNCLEYTDATKYKVPPVDGFILTSPVSDREAAAFLFMSKEELEESVKIAKGFVDDGKGEEVMMPREYLPAMFWSAPISAYRWWSLAAVGGDDDYFSSDLTDERIKELFGRVDKPLLILPAGEDEMVPPDVDRQSLLNRWIAGCNQGVVSEFSGFIPGSGHVVSEKPAMEWVAERVRKFLAQVEVA